MDLQTLDYVAQFGLGIVGASAIFLVSRDNRWGFVLGLLSQPFWFMTAFINEQWGIGVLSIFYTYSWWSGVYNKFIARP